MTIEEAFDEVAVIRENREGIRNILGVFGLTVPASDGGDPDFSLVNTEIKTVVGALMQYRDGIDVSLDAKKALLTGLGRVIMGKPAEGVSDRVLDADISANIDLI